MSHNPLPFAPLAAPLLQRGSLPAEAAPAASFSHELLQHRRLFAQFESLQRPLAQAVALSSELLQHGARLVVLGHGASQQVAALLVGEINRRARRWALAGVQRAVAVTAADGASCFVEASGRSGDIALWLAGSGDSESLLRAVASASRRGIANVAIVGSGGGAVRTLADICLAVEHDNPMRVHEAQLFLGHALVRQIDAVLRPSPVAAPVGVIA